LENEVKENRKAIVSMENTLVNKIRGLYDNREVVNDKLDSLNEKVDKVQIDVNTLIIKNAYNDNRIIKLSKNKDMLNE
jgi:hypothetical protein